MQENPTALEALESFFGSLAQRDFLLRSDLYAGLSCISLSDGDDEPKARAQTVVIGLLSHDDPGEHIQSTKLQNYIESQAQVARRAADHATANAKEGTDPSA